MSTQPKNLCKLRRGKALAAFPTFPDTFNWLVDFCSNLIGEGEDPTQSGTGASTLRVDRTVTDHPVIRGGGSGGSGYTGELMRIVGVSLQSDGVCVRHATEVYNNGSLVSVSEPGEWILAIPTTPHSQI